MVTQFRAIGSKIKLRHGGLKREIKSKFNGSEEVSSFSALQHLILKKMKRIVSADDNGKTIKLTDCSNYNQLIFYHKYKKRISNYTPTALYSNLLLIFIKAKKIPSQSIQINRLKVFSSEDGVGVKKFPD